MSEEKKNEELVVEKQDLSSLMSHLAAKFCTAILAEARDGNNTSGCITMCIVSNNSIKRICVPLGALTSDSMAVIKLSENLLAKEADNVLDGVSALSKLSHSLSDLPSEPAEEDNESV